MESLCGLRMVQGAETRRRNLQKAFSFLAQNRAPVVVADQRRTQQELMRSQDGLHCEANSRSLRSGEGQGEGTLRKPARWRTAAGVNHSERRKSKLDASQSADTLKVARRLPPHPAPPLMERTRVVSC